jgi:hypothetical protein
LETTEKKFLTHTVSAKATWEAVDDFREDGQLYIRKFTCQKKKIPCLAAVGSIKFCDFF